MTTLAEQMWNDAILEAERIHKSIYNPKSDEDWIQFINLFWDKLDLTDKQMAIRVIRRQAEISLMTRIKEEMNK
jgi:hypothetical protein